MIEMSPMFEEIEVEHKSNVKTMGELTDEELIFELHKSVKDECRTAIELCVLFIKFKGLSNDVRIDYPELFV